MLVSFLAALLASSGLLASAQIVRTDPGSYGPALEVAHLYYDEWPTGVAVASTGRMFSCYPAGLDGNNTNTGANGKYQVAELFANNTEKPFPSVAINSPPGGAINYTTYPPSSAGDASHFVGVQSVVVDSLDRLWILDTGRAIDPVSGMLTNAAYGGPKLVGINLRNNSVFQTIVFPPTVAYPDSYLNDVRFDLRGNLSSVNGSGVAYITDSSSEGRNGIVIVDLASGNSWRHLNMDPRVHPAQQFVPWVWGTPIYGYLAGQPRSFVNFGADGIAISADGLTLYFCPLSSRQLYSVPTAVLRLQTTVSDQQAMAAVVAHGEKGVTDGMETDSNGLIYYGNVEQEAVGTYNPANETFSPFVRDPRLNWIDTMSVANGYLYFTSNQLEFGPQAWPGTHRFQRPFVLFRAKLPGNATRISLV